MSTGVAIVVGLVYGCGLVAGLVLAEVLGLNAAAYRAGERLRDRWEAR